MRRSALFLLFLGLTIALFDSHAWSEEAPRKPAAPVAATTGEDGVQRVEILAGSYFFKPDHIVLKVNVPAELTVRKEGGVAPHDIKARAPDAGISFVLDLSTDPKSVTFTPTKVGTYPFFCSKKLLFFKSHRDRGMEGVLEVVE